jgi:hypothetical protein
LENWLGVLGIIYETSILEIHPVPTFFGTLRFQLDELTPVSLLNKCMFRPLDSKCIENLALWSHEISVLSWKIEI